MPSPSHLADPLFASGHHSVCKKIKTVDTQQKGAAWCLESLRLHRTKESSCGIPGCKKAKEKSKKCASMTRSLL
ncbi:hypothetical protein CapIbe_000907 [Capra ibex]